MPRSLKKRQISFRPVCHVQIFCSYDGKMIEQLWSLCLKIMEMRGLVLLKLLVTFLCPMMTDGRTCVYKKSRTLIGRLKRSVGAQITVRSSRAEMIHQPTLTLRLPTCLTISKTKTKLSSRAKERFELNTNCDQIFHVLKPQLLKNIHSIALKIIFKSSFFSSQHTSIWWLKQANGQTNSNNSNWIFFFVISFIATM